MYMKNITSISVLSIIIDGNHGRLQLKCDGTRWRTGGEVKGRLANGVGSQYPSHYLGTWCIQPYYRRRTSRLPVVDWTNAPADLNWRVHFAERRNMVSARVPSHFICPLINVRSCYVTLCSFFLFVAGGVCWNSRDVRPQGSKIFVIEFVTIYFLYD